MANAFKASRFFVLDIKCPLDGAINLLFFFISRKSRITKNLLGTKGSFYLCHDTGDPMKKLKSSVVLRMTAHQAGSLIAVEDDGLAKFSHQSVQTCTATSGVECVKCWEDVSAFCALFWLEFFFNKTDLMMNKVLLMKASLHHLACLNPYTPVIKLGIYNI